MDEESGEWWYLVETDPELVSRYLGGEISVRELFDKGRVYVFFRDYDDYQNIKGLVPLEKKIEEGFLTEDELPSYDAYLEADEEIIKEVRALMYTHTKIFSWNEFISNYEPNFMQSVSYPPCTEVEVLAA